MEEYDWYKSERIINIGEFEEISRNVFWLVNSMRQEMERERTDWGAIDDLSKRAHAEALKMKDFEFIIEARRVRMVKDTS